MAARYERALDEHAESALRRDQPFGFLVNDVPVATDDPAALDIHLREGNKLMYYRGTTRLLTVRITSRKGVFRVRASADKAYGRYPKCRREYAGLMKEWLADDAPAMRSAFLAYLPKAISAAGKQYYGNKKEGYWQNQLCVRFGRNWQPGDPWLIIDRECVLGFDSTKEKDAFYDKARRGYQKIRDTLQKVPNSKWGKPTGKAFGDELDMLALDTAGRLVVIELKHGANGSGIYWGPLQSGFYHEAFSTALAKVEGDIKKLVQQKIGLGLLPSKARTLLSGSALAMGEPVLAIAKPNENSACWDRMGQVLQRAASEQLLPPSMTIARIHDDHGEPKVELRLVPSAR